MSIAVAADARKRARYAEAEWSQRVDLAACYRLISHYKMADLVFTHITAAVPGEKGRFLINPYGLGFDEVTASNLIKIDLEGRILEDTPYEINPAGYCIHAAVHGARHDVQCVLHTHSRAGAGVSTLKGGLVPLDQQSLRFHNRVAYHEFSGFALTGEVQKKLIADLGDKRVMILKHHGLLVAGRSVQEAFRLIYYLERACQLQLDMMQAGEPLNPPPDDVAEHTAMQWENGDAGIGTTETREWPALLRMLDRIDPSYRD